MGVTSKIMHLYRCYRAALNSAAGLSPTALCACGVGATHCAKGYLAGVWVSAGLAQLSPVFAGTVQSSPVTVSPSGSPGGSQYDSDSDMAFSVNRSSSASESSLGKESLTLGTRLRRGRNLRQIWTMQDHRARSGGRCYSSWEANRNSWKKGQAG